MNVRVGGIWTLHFPWSSGSITEWIVMNCRLWTLWRIGKRTYLLQKTHSWSKIVCGGTYSTIFGYKSGRGRRWILTPRNNRELLWEGHEDIWLPTNYETTWRVRMHTKGSLVGLAILVHGEQVEHDVPQDPWWRLLDTFFLLKEEDGDVLSVERNTNGDA